MLPMISAAPRRRTHSSFPLNIIPGIEHEVRNRAKLIAKTFLTGGNRGNGERRKAEGGRRKAEGGRRKAEGGRRKAEGGRRKEEGGRRKEEGGRRKEEGGRRKEEGGVQNIKS
jgi:ATP-dependent RNA helicase DHX57